MTHYFPVNGNFEDVIWTALESILYTCEFDLTKKENAGIKYIWENLPMKEKMIVKRDGRVGISALYKGRQYQVIVSMELAGDIIFAKHVLEKIKSKLQMDQS